MAKNPITDGTHEDHVRAGEQSHKNMPTTASKDSDTGAAKSGTQGGTHEQHVKAGQQSHKNTPSTSGKDADMSADASDHKTAAQMKADGAPVPGGQGGTHEQHVKAGQQSHKND